MNWKWLLYIPPSVHGAYWSPVLQIWDSGIWETQQDIGPPGRLPHPTPPQDPHSLAQHAVLSLPAQEIPLYWAQVPIHVYFRDWQNGSMTIILTIWYVGIFAETRVIPVSSSNSVGTRIMDLSKKNTAPLCDFRPVGWDRPPLNQTSTSPILFFQTPVVDVWNTSTNEASSFRKYNINGIWFSFVYLF